MQQKKDSKLRQEQRYKLPLAGVLTVREASIPVSVANISRSGCLLTSVEKPPERFGGRCRISFRLIRGYPEYLSSMIPIEAIDGEVNLVRWPSTDSEKEYVWAVRFSELDDGNFVVKLAEKLNRIPLFCWNLPEYEEQIVDFVDRHGQHCSGLTRGKLDRSGVNSGGGVSNIRPLLSATQTPT